MIAMSVRMTGNLTPKIVLHRVPEEELSDHFPNDVFCLLIPQPHETGVPKVSVRRPLGEFKLRDQQGLQPAAVLHLFFGESFPPSGRFSSLVNLRTGTP